MKQRQEPGERYKTLFGSFFLPCSYRGIMYNLTSFIAIVQQAIKKPLVTVLLPRTSYTWGWRCEYNYVQFPYIGQVIHINYSIANINQHGDRRWLLSRPIKTHNRIPHIYRCILVVSLWLSDLGKQDGCSRALPPVVTEMKKARYWQYLAFVNFLSNCIFAELQALAAPSMHSPFIGEGGYCTRRSFV